ncbi:partial two-component system, cell cycle sensor histidine kinase and response regulator CckA, partial [Methanosarcinales archaeon]
IGSGNLDFSIVDKKNDEFGELSHAFNRMTTDLKAVTASKSELEKEIIDRKRAEEALRESEEKYRTIIETANEGIWISDTRGRITFVNKRMAEMIGYSPEEMMGKLACDFMDEEARALGRLNLERRRLGLRDSFEQKYIRKDGTIFWALVSVTPLWNKDGRIIAYMGMLTDIIQRKLAEEALRKAHDELELRVQERTAELKEANIELETEINERKLAEEKIREQAALLDNAQEAIGVKNLENRLIYWNKGAQRLYGWTAEEAIGKNPIEFLFKDKEEPPQLIEAKKIVLEKGEWTGVLHQLTKYGKEVIVESHWTLIYDSEGKPKSILTINMDITEKKMFEAHLLRAQRMESIGILAGGIAHNLNNMLTPIMLSLQILKGKFKDEQSQRLLTILENNSQRSADLIKQVLLFSRGIDGERTPLQPKHLIIEIEKVARETFPRNIEIRTDIPENLFTISGDITQLHQVIMNLCVNARDAMPDGGTLSIAASNFFIDENYARMHTEAKVNSYVAIAVSDTGTGIPPEILDRIFDPFFTTKEIGKGTGLGLSTALAIVKSHGGFINVYSEVGKGTKFSIYLPAIKTRTEIQNAQEQKLELLAGHGELVLVAEDEESIREVTVSTLEKNGYIALAAEDGADAVVLYAQNKDKVKVVLMDIMMPIMDGQASIRAIHKINPQTKVIVVSGLTEKDKLAEIASSHAKAFLPKPYTAQKLLKTIHEVMIEGDKK